jgi:hypothetical protein
VAGRKILSASGEQGQPAIEAVHEVTRCQNFHSRRCEFDRERQTVEPATDLYDRRHLGGRW